jgi:pimeloyl-ACP methyl ester carboxylesterase
MRPLVIGLLALAAGYLLLIAAAWAWQERIVWQPPREGADAVPAARRIDYAADDGQPLYAYLVGDPERSAGLLIAFHGNAELAAWSVPWAAEVVRRTGWAVLVPEYRGYGGLAGSPHYAGSGRDARATYRLAREQLPADSSRIAYYGHSLGSAVATELASEHAPAALLLVAPFTSAQDMARLMRGLPLTVLWRVIGRVHFDTRAKVAALDAPVSVAHGERDATIPVWMGRAVHAAARVKGELLVVAEAGHNDVTSVAGQAYWGWLARALGAAPRSAHAGRTLPGS